MLTHIVCFKYKVDVTEETRRDHRERLAALRSLDGVVDLQVGADVVRSARSFDTGLIVTFRDRAGLDAYAVNPQHVPTAQYGAGLCEQIVAVDFE
ncbi:MAG: Dabb family protein [Vicinamibacterales bacterium]